jgi:membrane protein
MSHSGPAEGARIEGPMRKRAEQAWNYGKRISDAFNRHFGGLMAAAVSFFAILSFIPLLSVGVSVLGLFLGGSASALDQLSTTIRSYFPTDIQLIRSTLEEIHQERTLLGTLGLVGLLVSGSAIFTNLEIAFNNIWGVEVMRNWFKQRIVAVGTSVLILGLLFSSIAVTSVLTFVQNASHRLGAEGKGVDVAWQIVAYLVSTLFSVMLFALIYKIIPNKLIEWREALIGGSFAGLAFELAKYGFAFYLSRFNSYSRVYGSLGGMIVLVVWTYYSMTILFLGAEIAADSGTKLPAAEHEGLHHVAREEKLDMHLTKQPKTGEGDAESV